MQTFLPYANYSLSAQVLDNKRLGKQRVECLQIINVLEGKQKTRGWVNHPAVKMWVGYLDALKFYCNCCINEWIKRGFKNTMKLYDVDENKIINPWWFGNENFHRAMRARLIEKDRDFYLSKFPDDENFNNGKYLWPVNESKTFKMI